MAGSSRKTVTVKDVLGEADDPAHDFSAKVESTNEVPLVVERPTYFDYQGWTGGHDVMGFPGGSVSCILMDPTTLNTPEGDQTQFSATGYDSLGFPVELSGVSWSVLGGIGDIDTSGKFTAKKAGDGAVIASCSGISASVPVNVASAGSSETVVTPDASTETPTAPTETPAAASTPADNPGSIISVGTKPAGVGVNPNTNKIYVSNPESNTVSVRDGSSDTVIKTVPVGTYPIGVGVNPTTNRIYVANCGDNSVSVIDGSSDTVTATIPVETNPSGIGVNPNPTFNKIYVANHGSDKVSVIRGATNAVEAKISVGSYPACVGVNPTTKKVYVSNSKSDNVSVIDGDTDTVSCTLLPGTTPPVSGRAPVTSG